MEIAHKIIALALEQRATVALAESCTGGMIGAALTDVPGSSAVFECGWITYSNASKEKLLGVPKALIAKHGAVSEPVARAMAEGARLHAKTTFAIGITGIAGPSGGSEEKPVGTVYVAISGDDQSHCRHYAFSGERERIRREATEKALDLLYERLQLLSS